MLSRGDQPIIMYRPNHRVRVRSRIIIIIMRIIVLGLAAGALAANDVKAADSALISAPDFKITAESTASMSAGKLADAGTKIVLKGHKVTDFGQLRLGEPAKAYFFIGVRSSAPYREKFTWTDFRRTDQAIPADRLRLSVGSNNTTAPVENGGTHPPETVAPHPPSVNITWENVNLLLRLLWPDPPGRYQGVLTIEVMVI